MLFETDVSLLHINCNTPGSSTSKFSQSDDDDDN